MLPLLIPAMIAAGVLTYMLLASRPSSASRQRRYPRTQISVPVSIVTAKERHDGETRNISEGGILLQAEAPISIAQPVRLKFTLPSGVPVEIPAVVSYKKGTQIGMRFDPTHYNRADIERWIAESRAHVSAPGPLGSAAPHPQ